MSSAALLALGPANAIGCIDRVKSTFKSDAFGFTFAYPSEWLADAYSATWLERLPSEAAALAVVSDRPVDAPGPIHALHVVAYEMDGLQDGLLLSEEQFDDVVSGMRESIEKRWNYAGNFAACRARLRSGIDVFQTSYDILDDEGEIMLSAHNSLWYHRVNPIAFLTHQPKASSCHVLGGILDSVSIL
jgi:hypothetical protein